MFKYVFKLSYLSSAAQSVRARTISSDVDSSMTGEVVFVPAGNLRYLILEAQLTLTVPPMRTVNKNLIRNFNERFVAFKKV